MVSHMNGLAVEDLLQGNGWLGGGGGALGGLATHLMVLPLRCLIMASSLSGVAPCFQTGLEGQQLAALVKDGQGKGVYQV